MEVFEAHKLVEEIRCLLSDSHLLVKMKASKISSHKAGFVSHITKRIFSLSLCCKDANLPMSVLSIERLLKLLDPHISENALADSLSDAVKRTIVTVEDELSLRLYFSLELNEAVLYTKPWDGWENIAERFDDAIRDIEEMNKCFALGRFTASMFHALHVAEWGAIELGNFVGVTDSKKGWGPTQKKLKEIIEAGHSKLPTNLSGKFDFLEQVNQVIQTMVLAWRNKVDHAANHLAIVPNAEFTPDIAKHIIDSVKVFMGRLQEGLPNRKQK
jgi:hypothetical protein